MAPQNVIDMWEGPGIYWLVTGLCRKTCDEDYNMEFGPTQEFATREQAQASVDPHDVMIYSNDVTRYNTADIDHEFGPAFILKVGSAKLVELLIHSGHIVYQ